jgi:integrase
MVYERLCISIDLGGGHRHESINGFRIICDCHFHSNVDSWAFSEELFIAFTRLGHHDLWNCFWAALRISEALRLTWADVDFDAESIHVPGTKTDASDASVPLLPTLARELRDRQERQAAKGFNRIQRDALVFQTSRGNSPGRRNALRALQVAAENAGLVVDGQEPVGLHDLRHSLAASSFALGLTDVEVARLLRHANPKVTLTVDAGLTDQAASKIAEKLTAGGFGS